MLDITFAVTEISKRRLDIGDIDRYAHAPPDETFEVIGFLDNFMLLIG